MANFAITGAGGFIGSVLVEEALKAGHSVTAIDRFFFGQDVFADLRGAKLATKKLDIRQVTAADLEGIDTVIDLAALSNDPAGELDPELTTSINRNGRLNVVKAAREAGVSRYVVASSCSVYGFNANDALTEDSPLNPQTAYARSMVDVETGAFTEAGQGFTVTALRQATVFGLSRRMRFDLVVNTMVKAAVETRKINVTGGGNQWRPLVHVRDTANAFLVAAAAPAAMVSGRTFNIGIGNYRVRDLADTVKASLPIDVEVAVLTETNDTRSYSVSFDRAKQVLGYIPKRSVAFGVKEVYDAMAANTVDRGEQTITVGWYKRLIEAERLVQNLAVNGRML